METRKAISTYLADDENQELKKLAKARGRSLSNLVRQVLVNEIKQAKEKAEI